MGVLGVWDYVIVGALLLVSSIIGLYYRFTGGRQRTANEYLLAGRSMSAFPVAFSLMTTYMSAVTLLGVSSENYTFGTMFSVIDLSYIVATPIAVHLLLPVFYHLKTASVYEYLEQRFGYATRLCTSLSYTVEIVLYMGIALVAPALALEAVTGVDKNFSVIGIGAVCTFYAVLGGMKAVLITDVFQSILMYVAIYMVIITTAIKAGGFTEIWNTAAANGRIYFSEISIDPTVRHTVWTQIIGGTIIYLSMFGVNQAQVQRMQTARNLSTAKTALWWCLPILIFLSLSTCFAGLCLYYYYAGCDPLLAQRIGSRDQLMPLFIIDTIGHIPGLTGLFVAGIFSASLSTISATISSMATVTLEDYLKPLCLIISKNPISDRKFTLYSKLLTIFYGVLCVAMAYLSGLLGGLLQAALSIFGTIGGPILAVFIGGMCTTTMNQKGIITGLLIGLPISFWISFGQPRPALQTLPLTIDECNISVTNSSVTLLNTIQQNTVETEEFFYLYRISYMWFPVIGFLITFLVGLITSYIYTLLHWDLNNALYSDKEHRNMKYELLVEPLADYLRRKEKHTVNKIFLEKDDGIKVIK